MDTPGQLPRDQWDSAHQADLETDLLDRAVSVVVDSEEDSMGDVVVVETLVAEAAAVSKIVEDLVAGEEALDIKVGVVGSMEVIGDLQTALPLPMHQLDLEAVEDSAAVGIVEDQVLALLIAMGPPLAADTDLATADDLPTTIEMADIVVVVAAAEIINVTALELEAVATWSR